MTERVIEVPWCLNRCRGARVVLDVGYANADESYLRALASLQIPELFGVDIAAPREIQLGGPDGMSRRLLTPLQADIRNTPFEDSFFDLILCISSIEHVGMENESYHPGMEATKSEDGDFDAIRELYRITRPGGRLLLTVPFGRYENHGWFRQYDFTRLCHLVSAAGYSVKQADFFRYRNGWHECFPAELSDGQYATEGAPNATGVCCLELYRTN